jgi:uncharacterized protein (TIGR03086 family)
MSVSSTSPLDMLDRSFAAVQVLIDNIRTEQWSASTPCPDWTVRQLVHHVVGLNRVFAAMLAGAPMPARLSIADDELGQKYRESAARLLAAFGQPGVLDRSYDGPLGSATGAERLMIRLYDLLAHGWDLGQATGQPEGLPVDAAELSLTFVRQQLSDEARPGRFAMAEVAPAGASAIQQLVAFLGRPVPTGCQPGVAPVGYLGGSERA